MEASQTQFKSSGGAFATAFSEGVVVVSILAGISATAVTWCLRYGYVLYHGDALAHLNIARRIIDSRTPGWEQIGTVWLPLPHLLMLPFVGNDYLWQSGLAGALPAALCYLLSGLFLYGAVRMAFDSRAAGVAAAGAYALNPNLLYVQSTPMTEPLSFAALTGLLFGLVKLHRTLHWRWALFAALAALAGTLARYEGWFLVPCGAMGVWMICRRPGPVVLFCSVAALGPLFWLGHNWWYYGDFFEFYRGPYSARAIYQRALDAGGFRYPGDHQWVESFHYFGAAAALCAGPVLSGLGIAGCLAAVWKKRWALVAFLAMPPLFYLMSIYSSGTPIFVPILFPHSYYNTRYGLAALPLLAAGAGALVSLFRANWRAWAAAAVVAAAVMPWILKPDPGTWVCWKEAEVNSAARRAWTQEAAAFLKAKWRPGDGALASFGDLTGIFTEARIPLRQLLHEGNGPHWFGATQRPDLVLWEEWVVAMEGDAAAHAVERAAHSGPKYNRVKRIAVASAPVIVIYRRGT